MASPEQMRQQVIFIAGLGHSGTTLLDLMLGGHSRMVGLGEVDRTLAANKPSAPPSSESPGCACGEKEAGCRLWGEVTKQIEAGNIQDPHQRYSRVLDVLGTLHGRRIIAVDSSKRLQALETLRTHPNLDVRVIFLVRDVRSFIVSSLDNISRKRRTTPEYPALSRFGQARLWARENQRIRDYLVHHALPFFQLGYEELCMKPEAVTRRLCAFLALDWEPTMLDLSRSRSHVLRGNRMRFKAGSTGLNYDLRWFTRHEWHWPWLLHPGLRRLNRELVYNHSDSDPASS
jgi:hypothetical protein